MTLAISVCEELTLTELVLKPGPRVREVGVDFGAFRFDVERQSSTQSTQSRFSDRCATRFRSYKAPLHSFACNLVSSEAVPLFATYHRTPNGAEPVDNFINALALPERASVKFAMSCSTY